MNNIWQRFMWMRKGMGLMFLALTFVMVMFSVVKAQESGVSPPPTCGEDYGLPPCQPPPQTSILECVQNPIENVPSVQVALPQEFSSRTQFGHWIPAQRISWDCSIAYSNSSEEDIRVIFRNDSYYNDGSGFGIMKTFPTGLPGLDFVARVSISGCSGGQLNYWSDLRYDYLLGGHHRRLCKVNMPVYREGFHSFQLSATIEVHLVMPFSSFNSMEDYLKIQPQTISIVPAMVYPVLLHDGSPNEGVTFAAAQYPIANVQLLKASPPSCTVNAAPSLVYLGSVSESQVPTVNSSTPGQPFSFVLTCTPGSGSVKYRLEAHPHATTLVNNVLPNTAFYPANGVGIQIRNTNGSSLPPFNTDIDLPDWNGETGGAYFVDLSAHIVRTEQTTSPGNLNSQMRLTVKYQ